MEKPAKSGFIGAVHRPAGGAAQAMKPVGARTAYTSPMRLAPSDRDRIVTLVRELAGLADHRAALSGGILR